MSARIKPTFFKTKLRSLLDFPAHLKRLRKTTSTFEIRISDHGPAVEICSPRRTNALPRIVLRRSLFHSTQPETVAALSHFFKLMERKFTSAQVDLFLDAEIAAAERRLTELTPAQEALPKRRPRSRTSDLVLFERWIRLRKEYFPEATEIDNYIVTWSARKVKRCLASCNVYRHRVSVSKPMLLPESEPFLDALLYHEMCHAALGIPPTKGGRRIFHGAEFKALERRHPGIPALDEWIKNGGWQKAVRKFRRLENQVGPDEHIERYLSACENISSR